MSFYTKKRRLNLPGNNPMHDDDIGHVNTRDVRLKEPVVIRLERAVRDAERRRETKAKSGPVKIIMKDGIYINDRDSGQKV